MNEKEIWNDELKEIKNKELVTGKKIKNIKYCECNSENRIGDDGVKITFEDNSFIYFTISEWGGIDYYGSN